MTNYRNTSTRAFKKIYGVDPTDERVWEMPALYFEDVNIAEKAKCLYDSINEIFETSKKLNDNSEDNESMDNQKRKLKLHSMYGIDNYVCSTGKLVTISNRYS